MLSGLLLSQRKCARSRAPLRALYLRSTVGSQTIERVELLVLTAYPLIMDRFDINLTLAEFALVGNMRYDVL